VVGYVADEATLATGGYEVELAHRYYGLAATFAVEASAALVDAAAAVVASVRGNVLGAG
jgi:hypothetical protein